MWEGVPSYPWPQKCCCSYIPEMVDVSSRLMRERDDARQQLADASAAGKLYSGSAPSAAPAQAGGDSMDVDASAAEVCSCFALPPYLPPSPPLSLDLSVFLFQWQRFYLYLFLTCIHAYHARRAEGASRFGDTT